jgi:Na+-transporting NADH:ubiquinone oxidoreductase subunit NqrB
MWSVVIALIPALIAGTYFFGLYALYLVLASALSAVLFEKPFVKSKATFGDVCDPVGLEYLEYVAQNIEIPFVAIGGIKEHNVEQVWDLGARCVCMVTEIVGAEDIRAKIASIRSRL